MEKIITGDEKEQEKVLDVLVKIFSKPEEPLTKARWEKRTELDPWKEKNVLRNLYVDNKLVSTLQIFNLPIRTSKGTIMDVAGVANVGTLKEFRGKGFSGKLPDGRPSRREARGFHPHPVPRARRHNYTRSRKRIYKTSLHEA